MNVLPIVQENVRRRIENVRLRIELNLLQEAPPTVHAGEKARESELMDLLEFLEKLDAA